MDDIGNILNSLNESAPDTVSNMESLYYNLPDLCSRYPNTSDDLKLMHLNVRSLYPKIDEINSLVGAIGVEFDFMCFSETWLNISTVGLAAFDHYNHFYVTRPPNMRGGGVSVYASNVYKSKYIDNLSFCNADIESVFVESIKSGKRVTIGTIYRPPNGNNIQFLTYIEDILIELSTRVCDAICICGDFNYNFLNMIDNENCLNFANMMFSHYYQATITKPTRVSDDSCTLIDNIFVSNSVNLFSGIVVCDISDHYLIFNVFRGFYRTTNTSPVLKKYRSHDMVSLNNLAAALSSHDFSSVLYCNDINLGVAEFDGIVMHYYNVFCPIRTKTTSYKALLKPWIDRELRNKIKIKNNYFILYKTGRVNRRTYTQYKNAVTNEIRYKKREYYRGKFTGFFGDMKKSWDLLNKIIRPTSKARNSDVKLQFNGNIISDQKLVANRFNDFFSSIGEQIATNFPDTSDEYSYYLAGEYVDSFFFTPILDVDIHKCIFSLKSKSCHLNSLPVAVLKHLSIVISPILSVLINKSMSSGTFPSILKKASVIPLHKGGAVDDVSNYRPISLLSNLSKIFEKVMCNQLRNYFETKSIFHANQYGFRSGRSAESAMVSLLTDVYSSLDEGNLYFSLFLDLKKAFDSVSHRILLKKLEFYGIRGTPHSWLRSYLSNRTQHVILDNVVSSEREVTCGVPQGSILGPLLFLVFINDFPNCSDFFKFTLFADDSTLSCSFAREKLLEFHESVNLNLLSVHNWLKANCIMLNIDKTQYITFSYRGSYQLESVTLAGSEVYCVPDIKFLGVIVDRNLNFASHINACSVTISRFLGALYRVRFELPMNVRKMLYYSFIHSRLSYGIQVWYNAPSYIIDKLNVLQKRAVRIIKLADRLSHTVPIFVELGILNLKCLYKQKIACYIHRVTINPEIDMKLYNYMETHRGIHGHSTRFGALITLPLYRRTKSQSCILYSGCDIWNAIPNDLKILNCYNFKNKYKTYLMEH